MHETVTSHKRMERPWAGLWVLVIYSGVLLGWPWQCPKRQRLTLPDLFSHILPRSSR